MRLATHFFESSFIVSICRSESFSLAAELHPRAAGGSWSTALVAGREYAEGFGRSGSGLGRRSRLLAALAANAVPGGMVRPHLARELWRPRRRLRRSGDLRRGDGARPGPGAHQ